MGESEEVTDGEDETEGPWTCPFSWLCFCFLGTKKKREIGGLLLGAHVRGTCEKMKMGRLGHGYRKPGAGPILLLL